MYKLTDAQKRAVEKMRKYGQMEQRYMYDSSWYFSGNPWTEVTNESMLSLARIGLVKIDGNTATLTEGAEKDG